MSTAAAIGIDIGSQNTVIGVAKKGGVEIMINEGSHRETPFIVGYGNNERFIGEAGNVQLKSNFKNTVVYAGRFLGLKSDSPHLADEAKFLYNKVATTEDNRVAFQVNYRSEPHTLLPEQVTATMLQKLKDIIRKNDISHNDFVLTVPSYYTEQERRALLDAAKLADISVVRLLNEHSAIAYAYGIFRKAELDATPRNVAFVDVGHSSTSVFIGSFTKDKVTILDQHHERNLGARDLDWVLLDFYANMFNSANGLNPMKSEKARLRLLEAIEKQRKILSANNEAGINIEYLMEDCDLNHVLTREKFEQMIAPAVTKFREVFGKLNTTKYPLHSVELVGGATRIPSIQKGITDAFGLPLSRTMNSTECIARGAAIQAAMLSPLFKVAEYGLEDANYHPIRCSWSFLENPQAAQEGKMDVEDARNNPAKQRSVLFDAGCHVPNVKAVSFHREDAVAFKLFYEPVPAGAERLLASYLIHNTKPEKPEFKVKLRVHLNRNGVAEWDSSQLIEEWEELEPAAPAKEGEAPGEAKKKKKTRSVDVKTEITHQHGLSQKQIAQFYEEECQMANQDRIIIETNFKKNELESYIYEMRGKLSDKYEKYVDASIKDSFLAKLSETEEWLYGEGAKASKGAYTGKLDELKKVGDPVNKRANEYENLPETIQHLSSAIDNVEQTLTAANPNLDHVTAEERKPVLDLCKTLRQWVFTALSTIEKAPRNKDAPVSISEIQQKLTELQNKATPLAMKPKPQPPKEPKAEEKKADEMKDEKDEGKKADANMDIEK